MRSACLGFGLFIAAGASGVQADDDAEQAREALRAGRILPLAKIVEVVQREVPGEVLEVDLDMDDDDDGPKYEIRVVTAKGRIVEIEVDAATGSITDIDEDD